MGKCVLCNQIALMLNLFGICASKNDYYFITLKQYWPSSLVE